ncbi:MAG: hypothetical protein N3B21_02300 [Clostridia bacterium]|nr:hypothetical protein [Clostridia bacterium]
MRKLNMYRPGPFFLGWGLFFSIIFPLLLHLITFIAGNNAYFSLAIRASNTIGTVVILILCILICFELLQDKVLDRFFEKNTNVKIRISEKYFECQKCGNNKVHEDQTYCTICGVGFKDKQKAPFNIYY